MVFNSRLFGQLALSRALGDYSLKPYGLSATPSMYKYNVSEKDMYVVIASDGVWDVVSEEEVSKTCNDVNRKGNCKVIAKDIVDMAVAKGSSDNISVIVIRLN
jgi:serine/threonine protein phosphatase PrpC